MPVRKYRDLKEFQAMEDALWRELGDPELLRAIARVWRFSDHTFPRHFPPGVYKHRSLEEAERLREQWEASDFEALWALRGIKPQDLARKKR